MEMEVERTTYAELVEEAPLRPSTPSARYTAALSSQAADFGPRLVRNGTARIEVQDLDVSLASAQEIASTVDGFVAGSELREGREGARTAALVLRVPSDTFQNVLDRLPELGRLLSVSSSAEDVSREYMDIETRLSVGEETVARLRELASRGGELEDLLAAERELGRALTELESLAGRVRFYDQRVAEADLHIIFVEPGAVIAPGAFRPVVEAFRDGTQTFARSVAFVIRLVISVVPWIVLSTALWVAFGRRLHLRRPRVHPSAR
jgi:hypothetical protein